MKIYDRLILAICSICLAVISFVLILIPFDINGIFTIDSGIQIVESMKSNYWYSVIGLIFFLISIRILLSGISTKSRENSQSFLVMRNEFGEIIIYEDTIIGLVQNVANKFSGIRSIKTRVNLVDGQVNLVIKGEVTGEINIPDLGRDLQTRIKENIEIITGAKTGDIKIEIGNVSASNSRVK